MAFLLNCTSLRKYAAAAGVFIFISFFILSCTTLEPSREYLEINLRGPQHPAGSVEVEFEAMFTRTGLEKGQIHVNYFPDDDIVCLVIRHNFTTYYQFWNKASREVFIKGLEQYKQDYEQRNLNRNNMRTRRVYGTVRGYVIWESSTLGMQGDSHPNIDLGYQFRDRSPFFSIQMQEAKNQNDVTYDSMKQSPIFNFHMTRARGDELAALFDQDYLQGLSSASRN